MCNTIRRFSRLKHFTRPSNDLDSCGQGQYKISIWFHWLKQSNFHSKRFFDRSVLSKFVTLSRFTRRTKAFPAWIINPVRGKVILENSWSQLTSRVRRYEKKELNTSSIMTWYEWRSPCPDFDPNLFFTLSHFDEREFNFYTVTGGIFFPLITAKIRFIVSRHVPYVFFFFFLMKNSLVGK